MKTEFSHYLRPYVKEVVFEGFEEKLSSSVLDECVERAQRAERIEHCPPRYGALLCSSIAFQLSSLLAKALKKDASAEIMPERLANAVRARIEESVETPYFQLSCGIHGHLNAVPTELFLRSYLEALLTRGEEVLFSQQSFVCIPGAHSTPSKTVGYRCSEDDWKLILDRTTRSGSQEISRFLQKRGEGDSLTSDERLMLLSLFSDADIEVRAFEDGLFSRHNTPWYIRRFLSDSVRYVQMLEEALCSSFSLADAELRCLTLLVPSKDPLDAALSEILGGLLQLRAVIHESFHKRRPERVIAHLLLMLRQFYCCYNHPKGRVLGAAAPEKLHTRGLLTCLLRDNTLRVLRLFEFSCADQ